MDSFEYIEMNCKRMQCKDEAWVVWLGTAFRGCRVTDRVMGCRVPFKTGDTLRGEWVLNLQEGIFSMDPFMVIWITHKCAHKHARTRARTYTHTRARAHTHTHTHTQSYVKLLTAGVVAHPLLIWRWICWASDLSQTGLLSRVFVKSAFAYDER